jgi:hypothetical protein
VSDTVPDASVARPARHPARDGRHAPPTPREGTLPASTDRRRRAIMNVQFRRELSGLHSAEVLIDQKPVSFHNEVARQNLEPNRDYVLDWRLRGLTGGSAKVTMTAGGVVETLFEATLTQGDGGDLSNGRILRLKGAGQ